MHDQDESKSIGIIGGGVAGLAAAKLLTDENHKVAIFDKGRIPGGRAATRGPSPFAFDHGAQYFTGRDPEFKRFIEQCVRSNKVAQWYGRIMKIGPDSATLLENQEPRWVGIPQMNAIAKHLSEGQEISSSTRIVQLERTNNQWHLHDEQGRSWGPFDDLLITTPAEQAADLVGDLSPISSVLRQVEMQPCWAVLCGFAKPLDVSFDGAFCHDSHLSWVCRNNSKPGRSQAESWVLHASREWTSTHQSLDKIQVSRQLIKELERLTLTTLPDVTHTDAHFWKYSQPKDELASKNIQDLSIHLHVAGDAFQGGRVEGAWLSGVKAARTIMG
ncbi:MAG: renalase [Planctomycetota bacterium]|jgi:renalase